MVITNKNETHGENNENNMETVFTSFPFADVSFE